MLAHFKKPVVFIPLLIMAALLVFAAGYATRMASVSQSDLMDAAVSSVAIPLDEMTVANGKLELFQSIGEDGYAENTFLLRFNPTGAKLSYISTVVMATSSDGSLADMVLYVDDYGYPHTFRITVIDSKIVRVEDMTPQGP